MDAYQFLVNSPHSRYSFYISLQNSLIKQNEQLNALNINETIGIECALWPNLYPRTDWCESSISGSESRHSSKNSFIAKVFSEIADYFLNQLRSETGHGPTQLAAFETYHIAHTLE